MKNKIVIFILAFVLLFSTLAITSSAEEIPDTVLNKTYTITFEKSFMDFQGAIFQIYGTYEHTYNGNVVTGSFSNIKFGRDGTSMAPGISLGTKYFSKGTLKLTFTSPPNNNFYDYTNKYLIYILHDAVDYLIYDTNAFTFNEVPLGGSFVAYADFVSNNEYFIGLKIAHSSSTPVIHYVKEDGTEIEVYRALTLGGNGWLNSAYRDIVFYTSVADIPDTFSNSLLGKMSTLGLFNATLPVPPVIEPDEPTPDPDTPEQTECDGSSCPATDKNFDNVCDDCMLMFAVPRNYDNYDLYNYNGHNFPRKFTKSNGDTWYLNDIYNEIKSSFGSVVLLSNGNFDSSMVYVLVNLTNNPQTPLVVKNGQAVLTGGKTMVSLYKAEYDENGVPYWKFSATDTWSTEGALLANIDQIKWSMGNILDENGAVSIAGDVNFRSPLAEEIQGLTAGILKGTTLPAVMKVILTLLLCGVGCLAFLTVFILLRKVLSNSLRT